MYPECGLVLARWEAKKPQSTSEPLKSQNPKRGGEWNPKPQSPKAPSKERRLAAATATLELMLLGQGFRNSKLSSGLRLFGLELWPGNLSYSGTRPCEEGLQLQGFRDVLGLHVTAKSPKLEVISSV